MRILLVSPLFPPTYWGMEYTRGLTGKRHVIPPLGLLTVAGLLPGDWSLRLVDENVEPLRDEDLRWADAVFVGAMQIQSRAFHDVVRRAHAAGKLVVGGGPYPTSEPDECLDVDALVLGEAEDLMAEVCADLAGGRLAPRYQAKVFPDVSRAPVPRFDLVKSGAYYAFSVQFSRGCPFMCEFCDITELYGRVPRTKNADQLLAEFDALERIGHRGALFVVDDNFVGNKAAVRAVLPPVERWMRAHRYPFDLFTEASVDLVKHDDLVRGMVDAGFSSVFLGIETPSREALLETAKRQNVHVDLSKAVETLTRAGLEVMAGFIVGFDADRADIFERQRLFISQAPIPLAMVGLLTAMPNTDLWRRLEKEGRLRARSTGDQFSRPNFETRLPEAELLEGYARLLADLYEPEAYLARCFRTLELLPKRPAQQFRPAIGYALRTLARTIVQQGLLGTWRGPYWRFLARVASQIPHHLGRAFALVILGEHMVRYTVEDVIPRVAGTTAAAALRAREPALDIAQLFPQTA